MPWVDLDSVHIPSAGNRPPASWGTTVNANMDYLYDEVLAKLGAWTSYTPTVTQGVAVSKTVTYAKYVKLGRTVIGNMLLAITSSGTVSTQITVTTPVTAAQAGNIAIGQAYFYDGTRNVPLTGVLSSTTAFSFMFPTPRAGYFGVAQYAEPVIGGATAGWSSQLLNGTSLQLAFHFEATS